MTNRQDIHIYRNQMARRHDTGASHPECADRIDAIEDVLEHWPQTIISDEADEEWIRYVHPQLHVDRILDALPDHGLNFIDSDTVLSPRSIEAAMQCVAAACRAVHDVCDNENEINRAFCAARPPGHHAEPGRAMGFCLFNNIAIAASYARHKCGIGKIAIIDFDVHHGNGTDAWLRQNDIRDILFISSHQFPFYPGTGDPKYNIEGRIHNIALDAGMNGAAVHNIYESKAYPLLHDFEPELMLISAGFDAHIDDPLGGINLTNKDFYQITKSLCDIANRYSGGRIVSVLEGGYNLDVLPHSLNAHLAALSGLDFPPDQNA